MILDEIAHAYERAEVTAIWVYDRVRKEHFNIFSICELCPTEQPVSKVIQTHDGNKGHNTKRISLDKQRTIYATRSFLSDPSEGVAFYRGSGGKRRLQIDNIDLLSFGELVQEPPAEVPMIIPPNKYPNTSLEQILPKRQVSQRVYTHLDFNGTTIQQFSDQDLQKLSELSTDVLGVDLSLYQEFIGSVILSLPNPYLREVHERLNKDQTLLIVEMYERFGKNMIDGEIEISDERTLGKGFFIRKKIEHSKMLIQLPCAPEKLRTRLFDLHGELLSDESAHFINQINIGMNIAGHKRRIQLSDQKGNTKETFEIETYFTENTIVGRDESSLQEKLTRAEEERMLDRLEKQRTFIYFPGNSSESKGHAMQILRELIGSTKERCIICDPYLSSQDVSRYAVFVKNQQAQVQLLSSASFLSRKDKESNIKNGEHLLSNLEDIRQKDQTIRIECKVLRGKEKSPLHDRFLVIDDVVYLLGSSLNEFGSRATTLFRAPDSRPIIRQVENWWNDPQATIPLDAWVTSGKEGEKDE